MVKTIVPPIHIKRQITKLLNCWYRNHQRISELIIVIFKNPNLSKEAFWNQWYFPDKINQKKHQFPRKNIAPLKISKRALNPNVDIGKISAKKIYGKDKIPLQRKHHLIQQIKWDLEQSPEKAKIEKFSKSN